MIDGRVVECGVVSFWCTAPIETLQVYIPPHDFHILLTTHDNDLAPSPLASPRLDQSRIQTMDRQYPNHHHHLFNTSSSSQLPPIHLPPPHSGQSFRHSNTLPPIEPSRYPPPNYHPSLSPPSTNHLPWPSHRRSESKPQILNPTNEPPPRSRPPPEPSSSTKDTDDGMPPTSDFVKKLYKCVCSYFFNSLYSDHAECYKTMLSAISSHGAQVATASLSRCGGGHVALFLLLTSSRT